MASGLPVVYHNLGGSINEYVSSRGVAFSSNEDVEKSIEKLCSNFNLYKKACLEYNECIEETIQEYADLLCQI